MYVKLICNFLFEKYLKVICYRKTPVSRDVQNVQLYRMYNCTEWTLYNTGVF